MNFAGYTELLNKQIELYMIAQIYNHIDDWELTNTNDWYERFFLDESINCEDDKQFYQSEFAHIIYVRYPHDHFREIVREIHKMHMKIYGDIEIADDIRGELLGSNKNNKSREKLINTYTRLWVKINIDFETYKTLLFTNEVYIDAFADEMDLLK